MTHRLYIRPAPRRPTQDYAYEVSYEGEVILARASEPLFEGCRALAKRNVNGPVELWDYEAPYPRMATMIAIGAALAVVENERRGPALAKYKPYDFRQDALSQCAVAAQDGETGVLATSTYLAARPA